MQAKSQEKFPDSEIERAVDTSPCGWKGMDGSWLPREDQGMEPRAAQLGRAPQQQEPPGPSPRELHGDISAGWSPRAPQVPSQAERPIRGSTARSARVTGAVGGFICTGELAQMLPPPHHPVSPFMTLGSAGGKETFPNTCPLGPPPSPASAESQSHSQPFLSCQNIFPGAGQSLEAAGTIPWQARLIWSHPRGRLGMGHIAPALGQFSASWQSSAVSFP